MSEFPDTKADLLIEPDQKPLDTRFKIHRFFIFVLLLLSYAMVLFDRNCPSIVAEDIAKDYHVDKDRIGIFTSIYYYTYAVLQPFAGLFADVTEPGYIITGSQFFAAIGTIICGVSKNITIGSLGRCLVGLGCGPTYVCVCRCLVNWYKLENYAIVLGVLHSLGSIGYLIAQFPLAWLSELIGWRWSFLSLGFVGIGIAVLDLIFTRGNPVAFGYEPINQTLSQNAAEIPVKAKFFKLIRNFKTVCMHCSYWLCVLYSFLTNGPFYDMNGMWASQYLIDIYSMSEKTAGLIMTSMTVGSIIGSVAIPPVCEHFRSKKWPLVISSAMGAAVALIFVFVKINLSGQSLYWTLAAIFFGFALTSSVTSIYIALACSYFDPKLAGSAIGVLNTFTFIVSAIYQAISSAIIHKYPAGEYKYQLIGYVYGVWLFSAISFIISAIIGAIMKDAAEFNIEPAEDDLMISTRSKLSSE